MHKREMMHNLEERWEEEMFSVLLGAEHNDHALEHIRPDIGESR